MFAWLKKIDLVDLGEKSLESLYTMAPYVTIGVILYLILSFIARKLPIYRKNLFNSLAKSFGLAFIAVGIVKTFVHWGADPKFVSNLQQAIFTFVPFFVFATVVNFVFTKLSLRFPTGKKALTTLISKVIVLMIIFMGLMSSMNLLGFDLRVLIGSLGISGLALGLAVKDSVSNTVGGILIILYEPFKVGDKIAAFGKEGIVEKIELKYVTIRENENKKHLLPNQKLLSDVVTVSEA